MTKKARTIVKCNNLLLNIIIYSKIIAVLSEQKCKIKYFSEIYCR